MKSLKHKVKFHVITLSINIQIEIRKSGTGSMITHVTGRKMEDVVG